MTMSDVEGPMQLWWRLLRIPLVLFVLAAGLLSFSELDLDIAHALFFDEASEQWIGARSILTNAIVHTGGQWLLRLIALATLGVWIVRKHHVRARWSRQKPLFFG